MFWKSYPPEAENTPLTNHLQMLHHAVALCNGPLFTCTLGSINVLLQVLKCLSLLSDTFAPPQPNVLRAAMSGWSTTGLPHTIALHIIEETYQCTVSPHTHKLNHYQVFSDSVYGKLMPALVSHLLSLACTRPGTLLLDLSSSVRNVMLQAVLQSGCSAFGVELMEKPLQKWLVSSVCS